MKKKRKALNIILTIVAILTVIFTVTMIWLFYLFQSIPETLVTMYFTTVVGELLVTGIIKVTNIKHERGDSNDI